MKEVSRSALVMHSAQRMFTVVNDVASYADFLPWCAQSDVVSDDAGIMVAKLVIARGGMKQSFTTSNCYVEGEKIQMSLVKGPFSALSGTWVFTQLGEDGCRVSMDLRFDFNSKMMNYTLGSVFSVAADTMVDAFCERADALFS